MLKVSFSSLKLRPLKRDEFNQDFQYKGEKAKECLIWSDPASENRAVGKADWHCLVMGTPPLLFTCSLKVGQGVGVDESLGSL